MNLSNIQAWAVEHLLKVPIPTLETAIKTRVTQLLTQDPKLEETNVISSINNDIKLLVDKADGDNALLDMIAVPLMDGIADALVKDLYAKITGTTEAPSLTFGTEIA